MLCNGHVQMFQNEYSRKHVGVAGQMDFQVGHFVLGWLFSLELFTLGY